MTAPATGTPAVLQVQGLGVRYGELVALDDVSWSVGAGELLGIIGPNGAGKSSCYDAVTAMVGRQGRVLLRGEDVSAVPAHRLAERGLQPVTEGFHIDGDHHLTVGSDRVLDRR